MKILVIIKVPEPLLMNTGFWETNQLSLLHTRHKITSSLKKSGSQAPWSWESQASQPNIEVSVSSPAYAWIRLNGKAVFENNMPVKEMCIQNPIVKGQYGEASNPIFEVFYIKDAHGAIADFSGNPPYEF